MPFESLKRFRKSKENRVELQYYATTWRPDVEKEKRETKDFVLEVERILSELNPDVIDRLRTIVSELKG